MTIFDSVRNWFLLPITDALRTRIDAADKTRNYRTGKQRLPLKLSKDGSDDNVILNFVGLVVDRSVSLLFGNGVTFQLPKVKAVKGEEGEKTEAVASPAQDFVDEVMNLNKQQILFHKLAVFGAEQGTPVVQFIPDGYYSYKLNRTVPRLIAVDPALVTIETKPDDMEQVTKYVVQWVVTGADGKERARKTEAVLESVDNEGTATNEARWNIYEYESDQSGRWQLLEVTAWKYWFPPYFHWQNLPAVDDVYGLPDITPDVIRLQDKINYTSSNVSKIIRYHAHPKTVAQNTGDIASIDVGPDQMFKFMGQTDAKIYNLEMQSDLASSTRFMEILRQGLFDITRTPDISSMTDKIGALTNFGLHVLWQDALAKLGTKRELYGNALREIVRYVLVMGGFGDYPDPGEVVWPEALPESEAENSAAYQQDLAMQIVSKQTVAERRGYNWEQETERMDAEKAGEKTLGSMLLEGFDRGQ